MNLEPIFQKIVQENEAEDVLDRVQEQKSEYVSDWEDNFEDIDEAYMEQGRGEAENDILEALISENCTNLCAEDHTKMYDRLAIHYEIAGE